MPKKSIPKTRKRKSKKQKNNKKSSFVSQFKKILWITFILSICLFVLYLLYLNYQIKEKFTANGWSLPAKIYADNLVLKPKMQLTLKQLEQQLKLSSYRKDKLASTAGSYSQHGNMLLISVRDFYLPSGKHLKNQKIKVVFYPNRIKSIHHSKSGKQLQQAILDPALIAYYGLSQSEDRSVVTYKQIPKLLIETIIATEDRNNCFY